MEIRKRLDDVKELCCKAGQDYMKMVVKPGWQIKLYNISKDAVENNHYKQNYAKTYAKMRELNDVQDYQVSDMDLSIIITVALHCEEIVKVKLSKETKDALKKLRYDRNEEGHTSYSEEDDELYLRGLLELCNLRSFVRCVDDYETDIDDSQRYEYRKLYIEKINDLQELLDDERIHLVQGRKERKRDIKQILDSDNPDREWSHILGIRNKTQLSLQKDIEGYNQFIIESAEAGVIQAYGIAADMYMRQKDYDKAEHYYRMLLTEDSGRYLNAHEMLDLANLYINKLCSKEGDGQRIIDLLMKNGSIVISEDGKRYELISRSEATKGHALYSIEKPQDD